MRRAEAVVEGVMPKRLFKVRTDDGKVRTAGEMAALRRKNVRVIPGDRVLIEVSATDPTRARIVEKLS